jgi:hypothetical protein
MRPNFQKRSACPAEGLGALKDDGRINPDEVRIGTTDNWQQKLQPITRSKWPLNDALQRKWLIKLTYDANLSR